MNIKKVITHAHCPDGLASAMIIKAALPDVEIVFMQYGTPEYEALQAEPGILFCDFSPREDKADAFVEAGAYILDHHKGAQDVIAKFGDRGIFADEKEEPGVSGAVLAYRHVWQRVWKESPVVEDFARLIGVSDTWQKEDKDWDKARSFAYYLMSLPQSYWMDHKPWFTDAEVAMAEIAMQEKMEKVRELASRAWRFESEGVEYALVSAGKLVSDIAEVLRNEGVDCVGSFSYIFEAVSPEDRKAVQDRILAEGTKLDKRLETIPTNIPKILFSIRSNDKVNAFEMAKLFGGGGHSKAAGFSLPVRPSDLNPVAFFMDIIVAAYNLSKEAN